MTKKTLTVKDDELTLVRLGLNPYPQAWPRIQN
jgi:hypothetical protein